MPPVSSTAANRSVRAFRALLALYPAAFRDEYGRELSLVFVDRYRAADSTWERARLWCEALAGILAEAPREHTRMIRHDLRYAIRALHQHALVTATIVITLGLGIGANTAVFSLLNAVALRSPLPVRDAEHCRWSTAAVTWRADRKARACPGRCSTHSGRPRPTAWVSRP